MFGNIVLVVDEFVDLEFGFAARYSSMGEVWLQASYSLVVSSKVSNQLVLVVRELMCCKNSLIVNFVLANTSCVVGWDLWQWR